MPAGLRAAFRILVAASAFSGTTTQAADSSAPVQGRIAATPCLERAAVVAYLHRFQDRIMQYWVIPDDTLSDQTVAVRFRLSGDGYAVAWKLQSWTSHRIANSVELAFRHASSAGPIPEAAACLTDRMIEMHFENPY